MTQPRYQIFVSSTFHDLQEERLAVLNAIDIKYKLKGEIRKVSLTCNQIILGIGQTLMIPCEIYEVASTLGEFIWQTVKEADSLTDEEYEGPHPVTVQPKTVTEIENQLQLLGLLSVDSVVKQTSSRSLFNRDQYPTLSTSIDRAWQFTDRGRNLFLSQTALRRNPIK